jgi:colicin import membrane protein
MITKQNSALVTYESVAAACEALTTEGARPSVRAVITRLGGGSPNVVLDFQRQWKAGRPVVKALDIQLDPRINQIIAEQISKAIIAASAAAEADRTEAEETLDTVSKTCKEAEARAEALDAELHSAIAQVQTLTGQVDQLKTAAAQAKSDAIAAIQAEQVRTAAEIAKIAADLTAERAAAEAARIALAKAELRLESVPRIEKEIEQVRIELAAERVKSAEQHEFAAVAVAMRQSIESHLADLHKAIATAEAATAAAFAEAKKSAAEAAELRGQLAAEKSTIKKPNVREGKLNEN